eukprot:2391114-Rhodomonas_salina.2
MAHRLLKRPHPDRLVLRPRHHLPPPRVSQPTSAHAHAQQQQNCLDLLARVEEKRALTASECTDTHRTTSWCPSLE